MGFRHLLTTVLLAGGLAGPAAATNLVVNGGFETGGLDGWIQGDTGAVSGVDGSFPFLGQFSAFLGGARRRGFIEQTVTTVAGTRYVFSFAYTNDDARSSYFAASVDGVDFLTLNNPTVDSYHLFIGTFIADADGTSIIRFTFRHQPDPGYFHLDEVVVEEDIVIPPPNGVEPATFAALAAPADPVPEPGALALVGIALVGLAVLRWRARKRKISRK